MKRLKQHAPDRRCTAFTLLEVMVATSISAVLLIAAQSVVILASRAIPDARSKAVSTITAHNALALLNADLAFATAIVNRSATSVTFEVTDRTGDGAPDTIAYAWDGVPGGALNRTVNGAASGIATGVQAFSLDYDTRDVLNPTTYATSGETLLASNSGALGVLDQRVDNSNFPGQFFKPTLPGNATSWAVTRVLLKCRVHGGGGGIAFIQVRPVDGSNKPTATVIDQATLLESSLADTYNWMEFNFSRANGFAPNAGASIVVQWVNDADACDVQYQLLSVALANSNYVKTSDKGVTWTPNLLANLQYYVYGTVATKNPSTYSYYLTGVRASLRTHRDAHAVARTTVKLLNEPQVPSS
jgi:prepilin-type N-terminal cleavage/methylation domain-containing protein